MNRLLLLSSLVFLTWSCQQNNGNTNRVIFAGEIVNPTSENVILFRGEEALDTALLDDDNRFSFSLDSVTEGLHHFVHRPESQYVYLENGDSLQIRLNTSDFDESLVYSGQGEEVNNFILEMYLSREEEQSLIQSLYYLEPGDFQVKIDSLRTSKLELFDQIQTEFDISPKASDLARAFVEYSSNISMEAYPFYHRRRSGEGEIHDLPMTFYDYRKNINYNNHDFTYLRPYYNFMKYHIGNLAYNHCKQNCPKDMNKEGRHLHSNQHKLYLIDSLFTQKELRDNLFRSVAIDYLLRHDNEENTIEFIDSFKKYSENNAHDEEIYTLYQSILKMQPAKDLPNFTVYSFDDEAVEISDIKPRETVVYYFWSGSQAGHFKNLMKRVAELKTEYPNYHFIGLNMKTDKANWKNMVKSYKLDPSEQYWTEDYDETVNTLIVYNPNKAIIVKDGKIVDAFSHMFRSF
ncbi:MAG: transaldolase [Flavobacteriaceae bacterium]|nr:transaldolase [Flavobacteriaceae bacterium]